MSDPKRQSDPTEGFVASSLPATSTTLKQYPKPVRLRFEPFGRPTNRGDPAQRSRLRVLDGKIHHEKSPTFLRQDGVQRRPRKFVGVGGKEYLLADGENFTANNPDLPEWAREKLSLSDCGLVLAVRDAKGYKVVGVYVELLVPDQSPHDHLIRL